MPNQYTKKAEKNAQRKEIYWNLINSGIGGAISFFSAILAAGKITWEVAGISLFTALVVALVRFQKFWDGEKKEYQTKIFKFL